MQQLENLFKQLDNINDDYEKKIDKLKAKRDKDTSDMWQRISIEKAKILEGVK